MKKLIKKFIVHSSKFIGKSLRTTNSKLITILIAITLYQSVLCTSGAGHVLIIPQSAYALRPISAKLADIYERKNNRRFDKLFLDLPHAFEWPMPEEESLSCEILSALKGYKGLRLLFIYPTSDALTQDNELNKLGEWKYDVGFNISHSFGRISIGLAEINDRPALLVRVQPNPAIYRMRPKSKQRKYSSWYKHIFRYLADRARISGIDDIYAVPLNILEETGGYYTEWGDGTKKRSLVVPFSGWRRVQVHINAVGPPFKLDLKEGEEYTLLRFDFEADFKTQAAIFSAA